MKGQVLRFGWSKTPPRKGEVRPRQARKGQQEPHHGKGREPQAVGPTEPSKEFPLPLPRFCFSSFLHHLCPSPHSRTAHLFPTSSPPRTAPWQPHPGTTQPHWSHLVDMTKCRAATLSSPSSFSSSFFFFVLVRHGTRHGQRILGKDVTRSALPSLPNLEKMGSRFICSFAPDFIH